MSRVYLISITDIGDAIERARIYVLPGREAAAINAIMWSVYHGQHHQQ
jgi:hypothetical protein